MHFRFSKFELKEKHRLEILGDIGKEIHFSSDLVDPDSIFYLKKYCNHKGKDSCTHEFGIYYSKSGELIYFHRCVNCYYNIRISKEDYYIAKEIDGVKNGA